DGIILRPNGTNYVKTYFDYPRPGDTATYLTGINTNDALVGGVVLFDMDLNTILQQGFVVDSHGPQLIPTPSYFAEASGINGAGAICGYYIQTNANPAITNDTEHLHGYLYSEGQVDTVDVPGSGDWPLTITNGTVELKRYQAGTLLPGINDRGEIVAQSVAH